MLAKNLIEAAGNASEPNYIEDVFSTYLYTGNGATQTINNGIDLAGKGGLVWIKDRSATWLQTLTDSARGVGQYLGSNITNGQQPWNADAPTFTSTGLTIPVNGGVPYTNYLTDSYASWTFRKQPKFFDVVTYTGNGALPNQLISHNLGSVPGCIIIKATNSLYNWIVWHRGNGTTNYAGFSLNLTAASAGSISSGDLPTATQFKPGAFFDPDYNGGNATGVTYVAYLFAHDAGGFGESGTDNVVSCGSFTTGSYLSVTTVNLGYEPQWVMVKSTSDENWYIVDNMRGMPVSGTDASLNPNLSAAESLDYNILNPTATGFTTIAGSSLSTSATYIYIAIRRGPMKVPTDGTKVFAPVVRTGTGALAAVNGVSFSGDLLLTSDRSRVASGSTYALDRLRGTNLRLGTAIPNAEAADGGDSLLSFTQNGLSLGADTYGIINYSAYPYVYYFFRRAPGFFDEVCYTGTGTTQVLSHNLQVAPQLIITKSRSATGDWNVYAEPLGNGLQVRLEVPYAAVGTSRWGYINPTATQFTIGAGNTSGVAFVAYLFASAPGVSKVGGYIGTGATQVINCGFTGGARFVLIKRTDSDTGDWYVWDSARGIVAGNDPHLSLNTTAAEVTSNDSVDPVSTGFIVNQVAATNINVSGAAYIFLAIA